MFENHFKRNMIQEKYQNVDNSKFYSDVSMALLDVRSVVGNNNDTNVLKSTFLDKYDPDELPGMIRQANFIKDDITKTLQVSNSLEQRVAVKYKELPPEYMNTNTLKMLAAVELHD